MRKLVIGLLILLLLSTGCKKKNSEQEILLEKYAYIYQTITDNDSFNSTVDNYDLSVTMSKQSSNLYRYDITIDNPNVAMYDIEVMAVENNIEYGLTNKMMPTIGILDNAEYNMVPFQSDTERNFVKGLILSGETKNPVLNLKIRVSYKDYLQVSEKRDYYSITIDYESQFASEEPGEQEENGEKE